MTALRTVAALKMTACLSNLVAKPSHHDGVKVGAIGAPMRNGAGSRLSTVR
jgi:hypothetical protein